MKSPSPSTVKVKDGFQPAAWAAALVSDTDFLLALQAEIDRVAEILARSSFPRHNQDVQPAQG